MKQQTEFGEIPLEWEVKQVIEIKDEAKRAIAMGPFGSNIKAENFVESGVPVIRGTNMNFAKFVDGEFVFLTEKKADELLGSNCHPDDLVFTHRGTIGQVALIPKNKYPRYVISQSGMKLTVNQEVMDSEFLFYFFKSEYGQYQILKYEAQVGVPSISNPLTSLKQMCVPVPPLPEQKAIASVLSSLDDKIDLLHRQNKTLEAMAETLFRQWFIEEAKEDWEERSLKELVSVVDNRGKTPPYIEEPTDHPIIEVNALTKNGRAIDYAVIRKYVNTETFNTWFRQYLQPLDIVLSTVGSIGSFGMFFGGGGCVAQNIIGLRAKTKISNFFLYQWLVANTDEIKELDIGSVQPSIKVPHLLSLTIKVPSSEKLQQFDTQAATLVQKILANTAQIQTLEKLRDTLLPKLMSGEVRVQVKQESAA